MTSRLALAMIALLFPAQFLFGQKPPDKVADEDGLLWVSTDTVLTPEGAVREVDESLPYLTHLHLTHLGKQLRYTQDTAREFLGPDHARGFAHGTIPPLNLCVARQSATIDYVGPETNEFNVMAMLSEVIVEATVSDFSLGFYVDGTAVALLTLEDVNPLRENSPIPNAVLVPVPRLVIRGGIYCEDVIGSLTDHVLEPRLGARVVFMGTWHPAGLMFLHPHGGNGAFAEVEGDALRWVHLTAYEAPETHGALLDLLDGLHRRGLMAMSLEAARKGADPREREDFLSEWRSRTGGVEPNCRLDSAEMVDGEWRLRERCADARRPER